MNHYSWLEEVGDFLGMSKTRLQWPQEQSLTEKDGRGRYELQTGWLVGGSPGRDSSSTVSETPKSKPQNRDARKCGYHTGFLPVLGALRLLEPLSPLLDLL